MGSTRLSRRVMPSTAKLLPVGGEQSENGSEASEVDKSPVLKSDMAGLEAIEVLFDEKALRPGVLCGAEVKKLGFELGPEDLCYSALC